MAKKEITTIGLDVKRLSVDLAEDMHNQAKAKAAESGKSLSDIIRALLGAWLKEKPASK